MKLTDESSYELRVLFKPQRLRIMACPLLRVAHGWSRGPDFLTTAGQSRSSHRSCARRKRASEVPCRILRAQATKIFCEGIVTLQAICQVAITFFSFFFLPISVSICSFVPKCFHIARLEQGPSPRRTSGRSSRAHRTMHLRLSRGRHTYIIGGRAIIPSETFVLHRVALLAASVLHLSSPPVTPSPPSRPVVP